MISNSQKEEVRQQVLNLTYQAIQEGMPSYLVEEYVKAARNYGQTYSISYLVENWLQEGRTLVYPKEILTDWANTLP
ncbi:hypothetical protein STA3757_31660 [Stanieria sp. NIES-3757]|nr:hypothetical protein STA3757_31660 [Stanieria sp. NIES-3757]